MLKLFSKIKCGVILTYGEKDDEGDPYYIYKCKYGRGYGYTIEEVFKKILEQKKIILDDEKEELIKRIAQIQEEVE